MKEIEKTERRLVGIGFGMLAAVLLIIRCSVSHERLSCVKGAGVEAAKMDMAWLELDVLLLCCAIFVLAYNFYKQSLKLKYQQA